MTAPLSWPAAGVTADGLVVLPGVVDCWAVALDRLQSRSAGDAAAVLADSERDRARWFVFDHHRQAFIASHAALRILLSRYLNMSPASVEIAVKEHGRPILAEGAAGLHFNLSHSGEMALIVISATEFVGVDVEQVRDIPNAVDLARRYFVPSEIAAIGLVSGAERLATFFRIWTRKEAVIKALGLGLSFPLDRFSVDAGGLTWLPEGGSAGWSVIDLAPRAGYVGALAVKHHAPVLRCHAAGWPWLLEET